MIVALTGIVAVFLPGIIGYSVVCWMMPSTEMVNRLFRALLIAIVTCGLGFAGGYIFFLARDPGPYDDGWHLNMARIWALLQLAVGIALGALSLIRMNGVSRKSVAVIELEKVHNKIHDLEKQAEIDS